MQRVVIPIQPIEIRLVLECRLIEYPRRGGRPWSRNGASDADSGDFIEGHAVRYGAEIEPDGDEARVGYACGVEDDLFIVDCDTLSFRSRKWTMRQC